MEKEIKINNETCHLLSIENEYIKFSCLDFGATITEISTKDKNGVFTNNVLAFKDYNDYNHDSAYLGAVVAPLPGRIKNHEVEIDGTKYTLEANEGNTTLHGGVNSLSFKVFDYEVKENSIKLSFTSKNMECGIPGNILVEVEYTLDANKVIINYKAKSDEDTLFSITNHSYFNLDGKNVLDHELFIDSDYFLTLDEEYVGSHHMSQVDGTAHDFRNLTSIRENLENKTLDSREKAKGLDHAYILFDGEDCVKLVSKESGKMMSLSTDEESVVVYTGNYLDESLELENSKGYMHAGIAFEPQAIPNGMNTLTSNSWYLKKDTVRETTTTLKFDLLENA